MQSVRMAVAAVAVAAVVGLTGVPAFAAPTSPTPAGSPSASALATPVAAPVAPATVCTITKAAAVNITGLVATSSGYVVIDGQNPNWGRRVAYLNSQCQRTDVQSYPNGTAIDPQDIAMDKNGTLWIADTGDDPVTPQRSTIALFKVTSQSNMTRYKFAYPNGPHNTEALLLNGNGNPIFVTKQITGPASVYTYTGQLQTGTTMTLQNVGTFTPEQTGTANKLGNRGPAQNEVTGGANSPDGKKVVLRTLTDAYEWNVTNGDVIAAITHGKPTITPMPNEDQGYAIAFTPDGQSFLTVSDSPVDTPILKYQPATAAAAASAKKLTAPKAPSALRKWFNGLTFSQLMWLLAGVAAFGFVLLLIGVLGIRHARRTYVGVPMRGGSGADDHRISAAVGGGGVYGSARSSGSPGGTVYGGDRGASSASDPFGVPSSPAGGNPASGGIYSGGQYSAGHYQGGQYQGGEQASGGSQPSVRQPGTGRDAGSSDPYPPRGPSHLG